MYFIAATVRQKNGFTSRNQHFPNNRTKVYGAPNSSTTDFLEFGKVPHMAAQGVAFFGEFYTHDVQFPSNTEVWT